MLIIIIIIIIIIMMVMIIIIIIIIIIGFYIKQHINNILNDTHIEEIVFY